MSCSSFRIIIVPLQDQIYLCIQYQVTYLYLLHTLTINYLFLLALTLIIPRSCYVSLVCVFDKLHAHTHTHTYRYIYIYTYIYIYILYIYIFIYTYIYVYIYAHNWIELNQKRTHIYIYNTLCIHMQIYIARIERKRRPPELFKD